GPRARSFPEGTQRPPTRSGSPARSMEGRAACGSARPVGRAEGSRLSFPALEAMHPTLLVHSRQEPARRLLRLMLEGAGFGCRVLADGDAVLDALETAAVAVVVVDARDPDEEGLLLLGLLGKRFPAAMRLVLHVGGARLHTATGSEERSWETSEV